MNNSLLWYYWLITLLKFLLRVHHFVHGNDVVGILVSLNQKCHQYMNCLIYKNKKLVKRKMKNYPIFHAIQ